MTQETSSPEVSITPTSAMEIMGGESLGGTIQINSQTNETQAGGENEQGSENKETSSAPSETAPPVQEKSKEAQDAYDKELITIAEDLSIPRKELVNILKADKSIRGRFGEVGAAEQRLRNEQAEFQGKVKTFNSYMESLTGGDPLEGIHKLLTGLGHDSEAWLSGLMQKLSPKFEEYASMDETQKAIAAKDSELAAYKRKLAAKEEVEKLSNSQKEIRETVMKAIEVSGLTQEEFREANKEVEELLGEKIKDAPLPDALQTVIGHAKAKKHLDKVYNVLDSVDKTLSSNDQLVKELYAFISSPLRDYEIAESDLVDIVKAWQGAGTTPAVEKPNGASAGLPEMRMLEEDTKANGLERASAFEILNF